MENVTPGPVLQCCCRPPTDDDEDCMYDVLLSYCDRNRPWVLHTLASELERDNTFVLCLRDRDYESAKPKLQNFVDSSRISASVVVVLSAVYLADGLCQKELDHAIASGRTMVAVRFDGCEVPAQLRERTDAVLDRSDGTFWDKLHTCLRRAQGGGQESLSSHAGTCRGQKGRCTAFPVMPHVVVERPHDVDAVVVLVQITMETLRGRGRTGGRRESRVVGVVGDPGVGKTVLALQVARKLTELGKKVFWMSVGAQPDMLQALTRLAVAMAGGQLFFPELSDAVNFLSTFTEDRGYVVIFDDAQDAADVTDAICSLAGNCVALVTCRHQETLVRLHVPPSNLHVLGGLAPSTAELLLLRSAGLLGELKQVDPRGEAVASIAEECHYIPAAIALVGSSVSNPKDPEWWKGTARDLKESEDDSYGGKSEKILRKALNVSYDSLRGETVRECLIDCCVFQPERDVPLTTLIVFWKYRRNISESSARAALYQMYHHSFIQRGGKPSSYRFHGSVLSYVRTKLRDHESELHGHLLESCRTAGGGTWAECLQDGYYYQNAAYHFLRAGWTSTLVNLLTSYRWLKARLTHTDITAVLSDFKDLKGLSSLASPLQEVLEAIRLSGRLLSTDKSQFEGQFLGRLSDSSYPRTRRLISEIQQERRSDFALYPSSPCLVRPGGCLVRTYRGHADAVLCVAVTNFPDRRRVFTGSRDGTVRAWELGLGRDLGVLRGHRGEVCALHLRRDDRLLASASCDCTIKLWDTHRLELSATLAGHVARVTGVAFTQDGRGLVSCSSDGVLKVWEDTVQIPAFSKRSTYKALSTCSLSSYGSSWNSLKDIYAHCGQITGLCFFNCSNRVATCAADSLIKIWDLRKKDPSKHVGMLKGHRDIVRSVTVTRNDAYLISCADDKIIALWNTERSLLVRTLVNPGGPVASISLAPDDTTLVSVGGVPDSGIRLWNLQTGQILGTLTDLCACALLVETDDELGLITCAGDRCNIWRVEYSCPDLMPINSPEIDNKVVCVAISRDGAVALTGSDDGTVSVWDTETGQSRGTLAIGQSSVSVVAMSHDNTIGAVGFQNAELGVCDMVSLTKKWISREHHGAIQALHITEDSKRILSGAKDRLVILWDAVEGIKLQTFQLDDFGVASVSMSGENVIACSSENVLHSWAVEGDGVSRKVVGPRVGSLPSPAVVLVGPCRVISGDRWSSDFIVFDDVGHDCLCHSGHNSRVSALAATPDGASVIITGSTSGTLTVCNLSGHGEPTYCVSPDDISSDPGLCVEISAIVVTMATSHVTMTFLTGDVDGAVKLWNADVTSVQKATYSSQLLGAQQGGVTCFCNYTDCLVVSGCRGGTIAVWDLRERRRARCWEGHQQAVTAVDSTGYDDVIVLVSASLDGTIKTWGCTDESPSPLHVLKLGSTFPRARHLVAFTSGHCACFATGSEDGTVRVYTISGEHPVQEIVTGHDSVNGLCVSEDGLTVVCSHVGGPYTHWKLSTSELITERKRRPGIPGLKRNQLTTSSIICTRTMSAVISTKDDKLVVWDANNGSILNVVNGTPTSVDYRQDGPNKGHGGSNRNARNPKCSGYEAARRGVQCMGQCQCQRPRVTAVTSTDSGELIASVDESNAVHLFSVKHGNQIQLMCSFTFDHKVNDLSPSDSGRICVLLDTGHLCFLNMAKPND